MSRTKPYAGAPNAAEIAELRSRLQRVQSLVETQALLAEADFDLDEFMQITVDRLTAITTSAGAVVELAEDEDMVYRAVSSGLGPHLGLRLKRAGSLSGLCVATRETLLCADTETDQRVDREACRRIGVRSMICAPLFDGQEAVGALKIFAATADAYSDEDVQALQVLASMLGAQLARQLSFHTNARLLAERTEALAALQSEMDERRRLEASLRAGELRLQNILAGAHQAIITMDGAGLITGWNRHAELTFGWSASEALGQSVGELVVPPEHREAHRARLTRFLNTGQSSAIGQRVEVPAIRKGGDRFPAELAISATSSGDRWEFTALMHDISERRAQVELFENAFHHAPIGMAVVGLDGRLLKLNEVFCDIIGYPVDEALTLDFQTITHADDLELDLAQLSRLLARQIPSYRMDKRYLRKDGGVVWVRLSASMVLTPEGEPHHFIAQIQDLTAERQAEARYRLMAENTTDIIVTTDLRGDVTFLAPACEAVTGYAWTDLMSRSLIDHAHPDDVAEIRRVFGALYEGEGSERLRWRFRHKSEDRWIWMESNPAALRDHPGAAPYGFLDVIRDVTVQKAQEDDLAQARRTAERATRSKADLLANISHELRTPLNSVIGFSRLLAESEGLGQEDRRRIGMVHHAAQALHTVVDNVLDFSKLEAAALELNPAPFSAAALVEDSVGMLEPQAAAKGLRLSAWIDPHLPRRLSGDLARLRQVVLNLLSNAVKFTAEGWVEARFSLLSQEGEQVRVRIEVTDTGVGIAEEKLGLVFSRFVQAEASIAASYGGTGLGLAISRQLIELMGGRLGVESTRGAGSTFWFELSLPLAAEAAPSPAAHPRLDLTGRRLLVVDDIELNRELMSAMLARYGGETMLASDGAKAVAAVRSQSFDLVLMDAQMPVMDGFDATRAIRSLGGARALLPIVALTASGQPEHLAKCRDAGMDDHLTKPLDVDQLESCLARFLGVSAPQDDADCGGEVDPELEARRELVDSLGGPAVARLVGLLRSQLDTRLSPVAEDLRGDAHALAGSAGLMGFDRLSQACRELEHVLEAGGDHRPALAAAHRQIAAARTAAAAWAEDLARPAAAQMAVAGARA